MRNKPLDSRQPHSSSRIPFSSMQAAKLLAVGAVVLSLIMACDGPAGTVTPAPSIENIWPHDDGRTWIFEVEHVVSDSSFIALYPRSQDVPPAFSPALVPTALNVPLPPSISDIRGSHRLRFEGMRTTGSGATGQNLADTLISPPVLRAASIGAPADFLSRLAIVRPDLAPRIQGLLGSETASVPVPAMPQLLHGGTWDQNASYIGTYGEFDPQPGWKYLEADLRVGHEFTLQLVPSLADDVFLHTRVVAQRTVQTAAGNFAKAIDVAYVIDYGISEAVNENASSLGFFRTLTYGTVTFAPTVGPVSCSERFTGAPTVLGAGLGMEDTEARLISTAPGSVTPQ
jgi:hypothetical protein